MVKSRNPAGAVLVHLFPSDVVQLRNRGPVGESSGSNIITVSACTISSCRLLNDRVPPQKFEFVLALLYLRQDLSGDSE